MRRYAARVRRVLLTAFALNAAVAVAKLVAGARSGSLSVAGDGIHSGVDALANLVLLVVLGLATTPPDEDHPFGHHKFETLAAFALSGMLLITAFELGEAAVRRLLAPAAPTVTPATVAVMVATLAVNVGVVAYERAEARRLGSDLLLADAAQTHGDVYVTLAVLGGLGLSRMGVPHVDALLALGVAFLIAYVAYGVLKEAAPVLTDRVLYDPAEVARVATSVPGVVGVHDIRSRGSRRAGFLQMHMVVDTNDVQRAHDLTDEVERRLERAFGVSEVLIHVEPEDDGSGPPGTRVTGETPA